MAPRQMLWRLRELVATVVLLRSCCGGGASLHSLKYFYVGVSEPDQRLPRFFTVGFLDDQPFTYYDSITRRKVSRASWMLGVEKEDPMYWEDGTRILQSTEPVFTADLENVRDRYQQNGASHGGGSNSSDQGLGLHTWQAFYGCELQADGSRGGFSQYGYNGRTFISFDKEALRWVAADPQAQITQMNWDGNQEWSQRNKFYLEVECIDWLKRYLVLGRHVLLRTEPPVVTVSSKTEDDGMETHVCRAHGFYPKEIDASWRRDGEVWLEDTHHGLVAPNSDGTFHYWLSIKIDPRERGRYRCHVEHDGLQESVEVAVKDPESNLGLVVSCILTALIQVAVIAGVVWLYLRRRRDAYKAAPSSFPAI